MTKEERNRAETLAKAKEKRLTQRQAAEQLKLLLRHLQRHYELYQKEGALALAS